MSADPDRRSSVSRRGVWRPLAGVVLTLLVALGEPTRPGAAPPTDPPASPPTTATSPPTTSATSPPSSTAPTPPSTAVAPSTAPTEPSPGSSATEPAEPSQPESSEPSATTEPEASEPAGDGDDGGIVITPLAALPALVKDASVTDVSPGESFDYTFIAGCSGLQESCPNAVLTDVIPADLVVTSLPESTDQYTVEFEEATNTLTVTFIIPLPSPPNPPGEVGLPDGSSVNLNLGVELPAESRLEDGDAIVNTAVLTSDDADPVEATATVDVVVEPDIVPVASKRWEDGGAVAGTGEASVVTLGVRNASSSATDIRELVIEDAAPAVFERFDLAGIGEVAFPPGTDQVVVEACTVVASGCTDADWIAGPAQTSAPYSLPAPAGDITGLRFRFADAAGGELPYSTEFGAVEVDMVLRDTIRSTGDPFQPTVVEEVQNCVTPSATDAGAVAGTGEDACASSAVYPAQATTVTDKTFFSDSNGNFVADGRAIVGQSSPVSALTSITNTSPFPLATVTITEPGGGASELAKVDVTALRIVFPAGATRAALTVDCAAGEDVTVTLTAPPTTVDRPAGCGDEAVTSVVVTFTGVDADGVGTIASDSVAALGVHGTLNAAADDTDATNGPGASGDGVTNCASSAATSSIDGVGSAAGSDCANLALWLAYSDLDGTKSAQLPTILPGLPRRFDLSFRNGGTVPATDVVMADPLDPTAPGNPFDTVRLADVTLTSAPPGTAVEVWDPDVGGYVAYDAGDAELLARALGFRITVPSVAAGQTVSAQFNVLLRDGVTTGTTFRNCAGVGSAAQAPAAFCSQNLTVGTESSGAALQKLIGPASSVRPQPGLPATTSQVKLALQNTGTRFLRRLVATDADTEFFDAVDLTGTVRVNFPPGADRVRVDACTGACTEADWTVGTVTASQTPSLPAGIALDDVRGVRVTFTAVPVSTPTFPDGDEYRIRPGTNFPTSGPCTGASICIDFRPRATFHSSADTPTPDMLTNTATGGYESRAESPGTLAPIPETTATHELTTGTAQLQFSKTPDRTAAPGVGLPFVLRLANTGTGAVPDPTIVEPVPDGLDFAPLDPDVPYTIAYALPAGAPEPPEVVFTVETDPATGQAATLRWEFLGWDLVPGASVAVEVRMMLAPGVVAGQTIENRAGASGDRPDVTCRLSAVPRPGETTDAPAFGAGHYCTSAAVVTVGEGNAFRAQKWVAGDASLGFLNTQTDEIVGIGDPACPTLSLGGQTFTRYPCVARVLPGHGFEFYLQLTNSGTNPATEVRVVDVFPHPGDTGVLLTGSARGTEWSQAPTLLSDVVLAGNGVADIDYAAAAPVCTTDLNRPPTDCPAGAFPLGSSSSAATAFRAIVTFPDQPLAPGESTGLRFRMAAPANPSGAATNDVAWNSFAHTEFFQTGQQVAQLPPTEPIKVGVALVVGGIRISKTVDDPSGGSDGVEFGIDYECTVTPESGDAVVVAAGSVVLADGATAAIDDVPAGAVCLVWEPDAHGLSSNAPDRASALRVTVPIDAGAELPMAAVVNAADPPSPSTTSIAPPTDPGPTSPTSTTDPGPAPTGDPPTGPTAVPSVAPTTAVASDAGELPSTGGQRAPVVAAAVLIVAAGALVLIGSVSMRRR